jgi:serine O-acetyltransferase
MKSVVPIAPPARQDAPGKQSREVRDPPTHDAPMPRGDRNANPRGIGLLALLAEDFRTHDRDLMEPGFWAIAVHRFGNARMAIPLKLLRAPFSILYKVLFTGIYWLWGINLPYNTKLGRRVRIWHHGGIWLGARAIGDDVHIRHNSTFGVLNRRELDGKPIIGNRVDVGVGVCILGPITIGDDCVIGPNSVVIRDLPAGSVVMGVPARQAALWKEGSAPPPPAAGPAE